MGPFEEQLWGLHAPKVYIYGEILRLFLRADFTYKYQCLSTTVITINFPGMPNRNFFLCFSWNFP